MHTRPCNLSVVAWSGQYPAISGYCLSQIAWSDWIGENLAEIIDFRQYSERIEHDHREGKDFCLYYNAKCPKCGSRHIDVFFQPRYFFDDSDAREDTIILHKDCSIELYCRNCDVTCSDPKDVGQLFVALLRTLRLPVMANVRSFCGKKRHSDKARYISLKYLEYGKSDLRLSAVCLRTASSMWLVT